MGDGAIVQLMPEGDLQVKLPGRRNATWRRFHDQPAVQALVARMERGRAGYELAVPAHRFRGEAPAVLASLYEAGLRLYANAAQRDLANDWVRANGVAEGPIEAPVAPEHPTASAEAEGNGIAIRVAAAPTALAPLNGYAANAGAALSSESGSNEAEEDILLDPVGPEEDPDDMVITL
jgi:hypothetical protein